MNLFDNGLEYGSWKAPGHPLLIEYSRTVMESIATEVVQAFHRGVTQGAEICGVLYGKHKPDLVQIHAWRLVATASAGSSRLSWTPAVEAELQRWLDAPRWDAKLSGLVPVGWVHSTTRRSVTLAGMALEAYERYFPQLWQIALVIRPSFQRPTMAGFFIREPGGGVRSEASYREFVLLESIREASPNPSSPPAEALPVEAPPNRETPPPTVATQPERIPFLMPESHPRARRGTWIAVGLGAVGLLVAAALSLLTLLREKTEPPAHLSVTVRDSRLHVTWDGSGELARQSELANLLVADGQVKAEHSLRGDAIRKGSFDYHRTGTDTGTDVLVRMTFFRPGKKPVTESVRYLRPLPPPPPPSQAEDTRLQELGEELKQLRQELRGERARARTMEQAYRALQQRLATVPPP